MSSTKPTRRERRSLHFDALIAAMRTDFEQVPDARRSPDFSLPDTLMAGLALFSLKDPSLLAFQRRARDPNLRSVFGLQAIPSDTPSSAPCSASCSAARCSSSSSSSTVAT